MNERKIASEILYDIEKNSAYTNISLTKAFNNFPELKAFERGFISELVHGVTEHRITIDYIISQFSNIKLNKINLKLLICLRMGIYQILHMDKIPESAAVNESVKLAKKFGGQRGGGFVNGVLRNFIRNKDDIKFPDNENEFLSVYYSYPIEIIDLFLSEFGFDFTKDMLEAFDKRRQITMRCNLLKTDAKSLVENLNESGISAEIYRNEIFPDINYAVYTDRIKNLEDLPSYLNGEFYIQDIGAMLVTEILSPKPGDVVIDVCAAPGGKSTHIAEKMQNKGLVYAFDIYEHKIKLINENASRLGIDICNAKVCDATSLNEDYIEMADCVLVDAPCSGFGIIGKKPDIKYQRKVSDVYELSSLSLKILENSAKYVKKGGTLVFSTCTILKEENERVIEKFLENQNGKFTLEPIDKIKKENRGYVTLYPNIDGTDGFFICKLRKC